jgi:predicted phage tail protein
MKVVKVYGALRKRLGQCRFEFEAATPAQAIKALCVNFPGLEKWLLDSEQDGVSYRVSIGKEKITANDLSPLAMPWSERQVFSITPVIAGAGSGGAAIGIGIGLIAVSFLLPGAGIFGAGMGIFGPLAPATIATLTTVGNIASMVGASLILGGIAQLISPTVSTSTSTDATDISQLDSTSLSGITNTVNQGLPVPICYGRCFIGSAVISSGLDVDQLI